jgi:transposase
MPRTRPPYPEEFRNQIVELARNGRTPAERTEEFEPTEQTIRNWLKQGDRNDGNRSDKPTTEER